jgi:ribose 5-phosphate isomerase A
VLLLGERVQKGLQVQGVPTSDATATLARECQIPILGLEDVERIDLCVDGVDEVDGDLNAIKGGGGALLREKVVASASDRVVYIADASKKVERLGKFPLPVEVTPFATAVVRRRLRALGVEPALRLKPDGTEFRTDENNVILDCAFGAIEDAETLAAELAIIPGVVEHGLFLGMIDRMIIAGPDGPLLLGDR